LPKVFKSPPRRNKGSRFRRHPFKDGNITVTLSNYDIDKNGKDATKWITSVQYGNGEGFPTFNFPDYFFRKIEPIIKEVKKGERFLEIINNGFSEKIGNSKLMQEMYEIQKSRKGLWEPTKLIEEVGKLIDKLNVHEEVYTQNGTALFESKKLVPVKQIFALYAINKISSLANGN
jgi:DNA (cytosine-5)-methyltransferase 1